MFIGVLLYEIGFFALFGIALVAVGVILIVLGLKSKGPQRLAPV